MSRLIPRQIGAIRLLEKLGEGGMAEVYRGEDRFRPQLPLAVKLLRPEASQVPDLVRRFLREGELLRPLHHPHLVEIYGFGHAGTIPYLVMELLPGGSFKGCWGEAPTRIVRRLLPVVDALDMVHRHGVIHRDLKPSNLLFASDGRLKITDFGVCMWEGDGEERLTRSQMVVGTLGYMAPEQHGDPRKVDGRCDIYATGAILYEFTTGQPWSQTQLPPAVVRPGFPPRLARILLETLSADPARRLPSMAALRQSLLDWLESAESAGWGEVPLPGYEPGTQDAPTQARPKQQEDADTRLGPYLDALASGGVGARRAAAEGLLRAVNPQDEVFLLNNLGNAPDAGRFALVAALGEIGSALSLQPLLALLSDPYAQREAAEAASRIAHRTRDVHQVLDELSRDGLGPDWHWTPRARLGDPRWVDALLREWNSLPTSSRLQALEAAQHLPAPARGSLKGALAADVAAKGGNLKQAWAEL